MKRPRISLIAAMAENRVIGRKGTLPWRLPADMAHFVRLTRGKPVIMGRRNYQDIGRPLPKRRNIVLTRDAEFQAEGCIVVGSPAQALAAAGAVPEVMVIGGEQIYRLFASGADRLYLTLVHAQIPGDARFPDLDWVQWTETARVYRPADADNPLAMTFLRLDRSR